MDFANERTRQSFSLNEKLDLIRAAEDQERTSGINKTALSLQFNMRISTVREILENKEKILNAIEEGVVFKRTRLYPAKYPTIEEPLALWAKQVRSRNDPVTGDLIKVGFTER